MKIRIALTGLALMGTSMVAQAVTPSYNFLELNSVMVDTHGSSIDAKGGDFKISGLIAPHIYFNAGYEYLESERFGAAPERGFLMQQTGTAGLGARLPLVSDMLDLAGGLDYVYLNLSAKDGLEGVIDDDHDSGVQASLRVRANFKYVEVISGARYLSIFQEDDVIYGVQVLGRLAHGIWLNTGVEYSQDTDDQRYTVGFRLYLD